MMMVKNLNWRGIRAITRKDVNEILRNKQSTYPMLIIPIIMFVIVPIIILMVFYNMNNNSIDTEQLMKMLPSSTVNAIPSNITGAGVLAYMILMMFYIPMYLIIPSLISNVTAASSFVGEKENRTIEGILSTKMTAFELVIAKSLASLIPAMIVSLITAIIYGLIVNIGGIGLFHTIIFPNGQWLAAILITSPLITIFSIAIMCFISQRVNSSMAASGLGLLIRLPLVSILALQSVGSLTMKSTTILLITVFILLADLLALLIVSWTTDSESMLMKS